MTNAFGIRCGLCGLAALAACSSSGDDKGKGDHDDDAAAQADAGDAGDGARDASADVWVVPPDSAAFDVPVGCVAGESTAVDLLFVIDNSSSMAEEQASLARELPRMVRVLASGDTDGDGETDTLPVDDLHVGVVSTDLGAAGNAGFPGDPGYDAFGCGQPGDDGLLLFPDTCAGQSVSGNFLSLTPGDDVDAFGDAFACLSELGITGCGLEQQLDSMLKALTADAEVVFFDDTRGHGGGANAGFLRPNALLAVVVVTDEDDCSVPEDNAALMRNPGMGIESLRDTNTGDMFEADIGGIGINIRCGYYDRALHSLDRYVDGLQALKPGHPERVIFAAIAGLPLDLEGMPADEVLADEAMQFVPEGELYRFDAYPRPACSRPDPENPDVPQTAYPARRIVELAGRFGENGIVQSICREDFSPAVDAILTQITRAVTCVELK